MITRCKALAITNQSGRWLTRFAQLANRAFSLVIALGFSLALVLALSLFTPNFFTPKAMAQSTDCFQPHELTSVKQNIDELSLLSNSCQVDNDCIVINHGCEFGCQQVINRDGLPIIMQAIESYQQLLCSACSENCTARREARCIAGQCQSVTMPTRVEAEPSPSPAMAPMGQQLTASSTVVEQANQAPQIPSGTPTGSKFGKMGAMLPANQATATSTQNSLIPNELTASSTPQ